MSDDTRTSPATAIQRLPKANPAMKFANPFPSLLSALACLLGLLLLGACSSQDTRWRSRGMSSGSSPKSP